MCVCVCACVRACVMKTTRKDAQRPYDHFAGGIAPRSLLIAREQRISLLPHLRYIWTTFEAAKVRGGPSGL